MVRLRALGKALALLRLKELSSRAAGAVLMIGLAPGQARLPINTEAMEARAWLARNQLETGNLNTALKTAQEVQSQCEQVLAGRQLDSNASFATAFGAAFEVEAQALDRLHQKAEAVQLLESAIKVWGRTSIGPRLHKNLNLLTLEGKRLPAIRQTEWIGERRPPTVEALRGKVVLVFFWAHWCPDCKAEAPVLQSLASRLEPRGLVIIAPTARYGYTPITENPSPAAEKAFIEHVFLHFYAQIPQISVPLDNGNFDRFGASTTPTLVLADRQGFVRVYHPGFMDESQLDSAINLLLTPAGHKSPAS